MTGSLVTGVVIAVQGFIDDKGFFRVNYFSIKSHKFYENKICVIRLLIQN